MGDYREYRPKDMAAAILKVPNHSTIVDAEAQIDDTHGVAAVTVSATGTADNRTLHFRFTGLRGRDGDTAADEYDGVSNFPTNGITGVIYIDTSTNVSYRWTGSGYVPIAMPLSMRGAANGLASLDQNGKVPSGQLPSYVDDVLEYANAASFPSGGESGKIYVDLTTNKAYRWSGSAYVPISNPLDYATQAEAEAGTENTHVMTPLRTKQAIDANAYSLPLMSETTRGGAKLGDGLALSDGVLSVSMSGLDATDMSDVIAEL